MSERLFEVYLTVCNKGSMTAAAQELGMTQPAVSGAVAALEKTYETKLFERKGKTIELTEAGRRLRQYSQTILDQYEMARKAVHEEKQETACLIGVASTAADTILIPLMKTLDQQRLKWHTGETHELIAMLTDHKLDFCIADLNADETNLTYLPLYKEEFSACVSSSYYEDDTVAVSQLPEMNLLLREEGSGSRLCLEAVASRRSLELSPYAESRSDLSLIRMAENGLGLTVVPTRLIEKSLKKKRLHTVRIKGADFRRQYYLIYRSDMYLSDNLQSLIRTIRTVTKKGIQS